MRKYILVFLLIGIYQMGFAINPMKEYKMKPDQFKIDYEEQKIKTADGSLLNTWIMKSTAEKRKNYTFIIAGSDAGNMGFSLAYAFYLLKEGFDVVTFDYRGFGESSDFDFNPDNLYHNEYVTDFTTVYQWMENNLKPNKIGVLAFSMGTIISTLGHDQCQFDFLVGESFILSPQNSVSRIKELKNRSLILPEKAREFGEKLAAINKPILLFASQSDPVTTLEDSYEIAKQKANRTVIEFDGAHLRGAYTLGMENYIAEIVKRTK